VTSNEEIGRDVSRYVRATMREREEGVIVGHMPVADHLRGADGAVRAGALLTLADQVGGLCAGLAALPDGWVVSTNLGAHVVAPARTGPLRAESWVLRAGRNAVVTQVEIRDEGNGDALVADGVLTSAVHVPAQGPPCWDRPLVLDAHPPVRDALPRVEEWRGLRVVGDAAVEVALEDRLRNPWGILHGGVVAMLVDLAAEHATRGVTTDVVLHFLAPNRTGPVRAVARPLGSRSDGTVARVEVRDEGTGRVTAVAVVTSVA